ncbi:acid protease [Punctularia strigosozonata HHB-11173 SS5]|uniref:acid protease n=1 Tax=Punctularia strigosozonata (strain HHB-11173) TaxID=741275 RepID=UPI0004416E8F|nr:acid protease [Punctularia strigosozonata HHB-11173 SS5]EIN11161.1 acid protease [Punctularia strigosozonata HHB-11173 SS5]
MGRVTFLLALCAAPIVQGFRQLGPVVQPPHKTGRSVNSHRTASHGVTLSGRVTKNSHALEAFRASKADSNNQTGVLSSAGGGSRYYAPINVGGQDFEVLVDTGSSDTWLVQVGFSCFTIDGAPASANECGFGTAGFDPSQSSTFTSLPGKNINVTYGDGTFAAGPVGTDTITVGGLTVTAQEFGVPNVTAWDGLGVEGGLLGLAYPALTSVFNGTNSTQDSFANQAPYNPFFFTAIQEGKVNASVFSVSLDRGTFAEQSSPDEKPNRGFLAFGGAAPVAVTNASASAPVLLATNSAGNTTEAFYAVNVDAYVFPGSTKLSTKGFAILDTGTSLTYVPTPVAQALTKQFKPRGFLDEGSGLFIVGCNATAPAFAVQIGGVQFSVDAKDLVLLGGTDENGSDVCISGVQDGGPDNGEDIFILGDTFLHNVVVSFDVSDNVVHVSERQPY